MNGMMGGPMQGLMSQARPQEPAYAPSPVTADPARMIQQAISLHQGHMDGTVPTDPQSQQQLMDLLTQIAQAVESHGMPITPAGAGGMGSMLGGETLGY